MRRLLTGYAATFNRRYIRHGQLFRNRYKSILCQENPYFMELVRYIHLTPLRARLVKSYQELCSYPFCGHSVILGKEKIDWMNADYTFVFLENRKALPVRNIMNMLNRGEETVADLILWEVVLYGAWEAGLR